MPARWPIARDRCRIAARIGPNKEIAWNPIWILPVQEYRAYNRTGQGALGQEAGMNPKGAVFQPELIELMMSVLDDAAIMLPEAKRTSAMKAQIASHILACAPTAELHPLALKPAAHFASFLGTNYSHHLSASCTAAL